MSLREAFYYELANAETLKAIRSARVRSGRARTSDALPYQVYERVTATPETLLLGFSGLQFVRFSVSSYAATRKEADALNKTTRDHLLPINGTLGGSTTTAEVSGITHEPGPDSVEYTKPRRGREVPVYRAITDFLIAEQQAAVLRS